MSGERVYPRWIHHPEVGSRIVSSPEHEAQWGDGWYDSPAYFPGAEYAAKAEEDLKPKGKPGPKPKAKA